ncbi:hypothetical protein E1285_23960 [Actinomadura sp. 7K507]|nr:hypothetical protein E1285_23960 [Actinomadura sp. 7K507]
MEDPALRGEPPEAPACPGCRRRLERRTLRRSEKTWGGGRPERPELWWNCPQCDWLGFQRDEGGRLRPMRRMQGDWADCDFCGSEESNIVSETWQEPDGELRDWVVCLACARSNPRRVRRDGTDDGRGE